MKKPEEYVVLLRRYDFAYHTVGDSEVEDPVYDALKREFSELFPNHPYLQEIGAPTEPELTGFNKAAHEIPMGSQDKATDESEFRTWANKSCLDGIYTVSEKLDGLSVSVTYWSGRLRQAITRGDGIVGYDVTRNVMKMNVPKVLPVNLTVTLRGEIIMSKSNFQNHFSTIQKNPRNAAVGLTKRLDGVGCEHLDILFYNISEGLNFTKEHQKFDYLSKTLKVKTPFYKKTTLEELCKIHEEYEQEKRATSEYEMDGLIACVDDLNRQEFLGETDRIPKYSIAYKFASQSKISVVKNYRIQVGRTGNFTPVAEIEPVTIAGATITNVTLHNYAEIERLGLRVGSTVEVKRSGDVIPKITKVLNPGVGKEIPVLTHCPACKEKASFNGIQAKCENLECPAKLTKALVHWLTTLDVMHFGEKLVEQLEERGFLNDVSDFYKLQPQDISNIDGRGQVIAQKVLEELAAKKEMTAGQFLAALSIPTVSDKTGKLLSSEFGSLDKILSVTEEELIKVPGIAETSAKSIIAGLLAKKEVIEKVRPFIVIKEVQKLSASLSGKTFCFTGVRPDKSLEEKIEAHGGKIISGVSKKLSFLVTNENSTSSKATKAKELGIPVISLFQLEDMVG